MQTETRKLTHRFNMVWLLAILIIVLLSMPLIALAGQTSSRSLIPLNALQYHYATSVEETARIVVSDSDGNVSWSNTANIAGPQNGTDTQLVNSSDNDRGCIVVSFGGKVTLNNGTIQAYIHQPQSGTQDMGMRISVAENVQGCNDAGWTSVFGYQEVGGPNSGGPNWYGGNYTGDVRSVRIEVWSGGGNILHLDRNFYIDAVRMWGEMPLKIEVADSQNNLVSAMSTNDDGWPMPNPLTTTVTFSCPAGGANCTDTFNLTMSSTDNARFFMYAKELGADQDPMIVDCTDVFNGPTPHSHESYLGICTRAAVPGSTTFTVLAGDTKTLEWQVWIQPSEVADLDFVATWGTNVVTWTVQIPQAQMRPLVFLPGYLGTYPPEFGPEYGGQGKIDPLNKFYDNLINALEQTGYEKGLAGSGATLIPFPYDWQLPLGDTGSITLTAHIQLIQNSTNQKTYANYNQVDLIAHSAGGLVARAYLESTGINNNQTVHTFLTLGTPHQGVPGAYVGKYGGDPTPLLPKPIFNNVLSGILYCDGKEVEAQNVYLFPPESYYEYFSENAPSIEDFMPRADEISPPYLIDSSGTPFPYPTPSGSQKPPSLFLDDLNTGGGLYDVTKLGSITRTISSYVSNYTATLQYQVEPPPANPPYADFWKYGTATLPVTQISGDLLVPAYSANLTEITALTPYTNIIAYQEGAGFNPNDPSTWPPTHVGFTYVPYMVRRIISYTTGIDVSADEDFWNVEYVEPGDIERGLVGVSCSPVRILITDPQGRRVGLDLNSGQIINEIPGAFVTEDGIDPQLIMIPDIEGIYQVEGMGVASGDYKIGVIKGITNPVVIGSFEGVTTISQVYNFAVTNPPPTPIFLPIIFKNSTGGAPLLAPSIDGTDSIFRSPIAKPESTTPEQK